jgi:hypothetical protein
MRAAVVIAAAVLFAGCPGNQPEDSSQNSPPRNSTSTQNPQKVPDNSSVVPQSKELPGSRVPAAATQTLSVQLTEYGIQIPETLAPGQYRLQVANAGKENHNFAIEGPGVQTKLASDLTRGDLADVVVDLKPGTYTVYCPVKGHRGKGMQRTINVK